MRSYFFVYALRFANIDVQTKTIVCTNAARLNMKFEVDEFINVK